ncbi:MAG: lipoxygenase family protein [Myxococcota bacterium]
MRKPTLKMQTLKNIYTFAINRLDFSQIPPPCDDETLYRYIPFADLRIGVDAHHIGVVDQIPKDEHTSVVNSVAHTVRWLSTTGIVRRTKSSTPAIASDAQAYELCVDPLWLGKIRHLTPQLPPQPQELKDNFDLGALLTNPPWLLALQWDAPTKRYVIDTSFLAEHTCHSHLLNPASTVWLTLNRSQDRLRCERIQLHATGETVDASSSAAKQRQAKRIVLSGLLHRTTIVEHAVWIHLMFSSAIAIATRNHLNSSHPLRWLLQPYIFGTLNVKAAEMSLVAPGGPFESFFAFGSRDINRMLDQCAHMFCFDKFDPSTNWDKTDRLTAISPAAADGLQIFQALLRLTHSYIDALYPNAQVACGDAALLAWLHELQVSSVLAHRMGALEVNVRNNDLFLQQLKQLLAVMLFTASVRHEIAGASLVQYAIHATQCPSVVFKDDPDRHVGIDLYQQALNTMAITSLVTTPITTDFSYMVRTDTPQQKLLAQAVGNFAHNMRKLDKTMRQQQIPLYKRLLPSQIGSCANN